MADWSCAIPADLLASILQLLPLRDCIRVGAVCTAWRSLITERGYPPQDEHPWLLLDNINLDDAKDNKTTFNFYSLSEKVEYKFRLPAAVLPPPDQGSNMNTRCLGSSDGWLITLDNGFVMNLVNPLTKTRIQLPSITNIHDHYYHLVNRSSMFHITKAALSWSTCTCTCASSYTVVVLLREPHAETIAFARAGDVAWTTLRKIINQVDNSNNSPIRDLIHHKGLFYMIWSNNARNKVEAFDLTTGTNYSPNFTQVAFAGDHDPSDMDESVHKTIQLVESSGDLFMLIRETVPSGRLLRTFRFKVFKLDYYSNGPPKWTVAITIGNQALFLGDNYRLTSLSLSAHNFPGVKENCIYFMDEYGINPNTPDFNLELKVFDLANASVKDYIPCDSYLTCPIEISFVPNLLLRGI